MNASQFNKTYPVGTVFKCRLMRRAVDIDRIVKTVAPANDLSSGAVVEINVIPYFVNITRLTPAG